MQLLICLGLFTFAFAGGRFQEKVNAHSSAVSAVRQQVKLVGDAQLKFKKLMETCEPKKISSQNTLLICGQKMLQLNIELQDLNQTQTKARALTAALAPEFAVAASSLNTTLDQAGNILTLLTDVPKKLSESYFAVNSTYVKNQFERKNRDSFNAAKLKQFCSNLQSDINSTAQIGQFSLDSKLPFSNLYKQQLRIRNVWVLANAVAPICKQNYDVSKLNHIYTKLAEKITPAAFITFKKSICTQLKPESKLDVQTCKNMPLSPYSIQWLDIARGAK